MSVAKLQRGSQSGFVPSFFRLPRETRDDIYAYAIPTTELQVVGSGDASGVEFARGMGDPSGFYFPFRSNLGILAANRQIRKEALRLAYRKTSIRLDDINEFIKFAILIGNIGRHNSDRALLGKVKVTWNLFHMKP